MDKVWEVIAEKTALSIKSVHGTEFQTGPICKTIYEASGSSVDWAFDSANVKYPFAVVSYLFTLLIRRVGVERYWTIWLFIAC